MNKKITVKRDGQIRFCILSGDGDLKTQFNIFLFGAEHPDGGYSARFDGKTLEIIDYISYDTVTTFEVLSVEDTTDTTSKFWHDPETNKTGWN